MKTKSFKKNKINVITLGCSKNIYDSEVLMGQLRANKFDVTHESTDDDSGIVIINTCGFIDNAKQESTSYAALYRVSPSGENVVNISGRDLVSGLPKEIMINDSQVRESMTKSLRTIIENIKGVLETTPPELVADIHERGIVLSGGGALLRGFDQLIARAVEIPVRIADDPLTSVVRGTGILLDDDELLNEIAIKNRQKGMEL